MRPGWLRRGWLTPKLVQSTPAPYVTNLVESLITPGWQRCA